MGQPDWRIEKDAKLINAEIARREGWRTEWRTFTNPTAIYRWDDYKESDDCDDDDFLSTRSLVCPPGIHPYCCAIAPNGTEYPPNRETEAGEMVDGKWQPHSDTEILSRWTGINPTTNPDYPLPLADGQEWIIRGNPSAPVRAGGSWLAQIVQTGSVLVPDRVLSFANGDTIAIARSRAWLVLFVVIRLEDYIEHGG